MKNIGIVVCNYNKKEYVLNCVRSLFEQTTDDMDIYMVDNASTDGSVKALKNTFGDKISIIENTENLGGSGGFNTGLRKLIEKKYQYIMCVDNDVEFDKNAVISLKEYLEAHDDVGMVGSQVFFMDDPKHIWSYGGDINFDNYVQNDNYRNCTSEEVPKEVYCTYVPACSLMVKYEAISEVGIMPEENFIYLDDMEWGYRFNTLGYKVAAISSSKVWHKCGGRTAGNTFNNYYLWRNRIKFFLKVLPSEKLTDFAEVILDDMFRLVYSCNLKGDYGVIKSVMYAFNDAVNGIVGKAPEYKIFKRTNNGNRLEKALENAKDVVIRFNGDFEGLGNIIKNIRLISSDIKIAISVEENDKLWERIKRQYSDCLTVKDYIPDDYEKHLIMCEHIFKITKDMPQDVYIDSWCNIIFTHEDYMYASNFVQCRDLFKMCKRELLISTGENR